MKENWHKKRIELIAKEILKYKKKDPKVLEIGCFDMYLKKILPANIHYIGLDVQRPCDMLCDLDQENINVKSNSQDIVIGGEIFEHLLEPKKTLKEISRILKKEGIAIMTIPNENHILIRIRHLFNKKYEGFIFEKNPMKHLHHPRIIDSQRFLEERFKILKIKYLATKPFLKGLAKIFPSLFARSVIFVVKNE